MIANTKEQVTLQDEYLYIPTEIGTFCCQVDFSLRFDLDTCDLKHFLKNTIELINQIGNDTSISLTCFITKPDESIEVNKVSYYSLHLTVRKVFKPSQFNRDYLYLSARRDDDSSKGLTSAAKQKLEAQISEGIWEAINANLEQLIINTRENAIARVKAEIAERKNQFIEAEQFLNGLIEDNLHQKDYFEFEEENVNEALVEELEVCSVNDCEVYERVKKVIRLYKVGQHKSIFWLSLKFYQVAVFAIRAYMNEFCKDTQFQDFCNLDEVRALAKSLYEYYQDELKD